MTYVICGSAYVSVSYNSKNVLGSDGYDDMTNVAATILENG
jgi:hypothetical protein